MKFFDVIRGYRQWVEINKGIIEDWNCTCLFGSLWRFNKKHPDRKCKHIKTFIRMYEDANK